MSKARRSDARTHRFDVFLAHNSRDKRTVETIAIALEKRGVRAWFDAWHVRPGQPFQEPLEEHLSRARSIAIFVGRNGFGRWEKLELRAAVSQFAERRLPVIPVMLPGAQIDSLPLFLREFSWVRFRSANDADALDGLEFGVTGIDKRRSRRG